MTDLLTSIQTALGLPHTPIPFTSSGALPSAFAVTDLACASIAAAGQAVSELLQQHTGRLPGVEVDRRLASFWFATSLRPMGWEVPPLWDAVAGDYATRDGWIRLHTNAPHHRAAAEKVLGACADRAAMASKVAQWAKTDLEHAVVEAGGCAAEMRSWAHWQKHPQGMAVNAEPLVHVALGEKWIQAAPVVRILALAMPFMTLQILFAAATDARGRPGIGAQISAIGAFLLPAAFLIGVQWGVIGLSLTWIAVWPVFLAITAARSLPVIGLSWRDWIASFAPPVSAAIAMAVAVVLIDRALPSLAPLFHLLILSAAGAAIYGAWLWFFARTTVQDAIAMIRR